MELNLLTKSTSLSPGTIVIKRLLVYLPFIINLFILRIKFMPLFIDSKTVSTFDWYMTTDHLPEPLSMIAFLLTLQTFASNYVMREIKVDKKSHSVRIRFYGSLPAMINLILAIVRLAFYFMLDAKRKTPDLVTKLLYVGLTLIVTSSISLYYSQVYVMDIRGSRLALYLKISKFWKYFHTFVTLSLLLFFSFYYHDLLIQSIVRILCLIVTMHLIMKLLSNEHVFFKLNYVNSMAEVKPIFLIMAFLFYFRCFDIFYMRLNGKSIEVNFVHSIYKGFYQALVYYVISCRHRFYMEVSPIINFIEYGAASEDTLLTAAFRKRNKAIVREISQFNYYFLKKCFGILNITREEMTKSVNGIGKGFWTTLLAQNSEVNKNLRSILPNYDKNVSQLYQESSNWFKRLWAYVIEVYLCNFSSSKACFCGLSSTSS